MVRVQKDVRTEDTKWLLLLAMLSSALAQPVSAGTSGCAHGQTCQLLLLLILVTILTTIIIVIVVFSFLYYF